MNTTPTQTIIQQIQPQCDSLHINMKHEKDIQGKTNRELAECSGVPLSTTAKFFSGALSNPGVFSVAALCIALGLSLDILMGIKAETHGDVERIKELERLLERTEHDLKQSEILNGYLADGIKERRPLIYGLTTLCSVLAISLMGYLMMDIGNMNFGFFTHNGVSFFGIAVILILVAAGAFGIYTAIRSNRQNTKKDDEIESN